MPATTEARIRRAARRLAREVAVLRFGPPTTHVYNPLDYAWRVHAAFIRRYGATPKRVLYVGMNPGPFGMAQTGVPFGGVAQVRDFLGIEERVQVPADQHPRRPIEGFACCRREVSGTRVWGAIERHYGGADAFFRDSYVVSYCPLVFMEESGRNRTPDKLPAAEREPLFAACDRHLRSAASALRPEWVVGIGVFARDRARAALGPGGARVGEILHPSPASPRANQGWARQVRVQLREQGICR